MNTDLDGPADTRVMRIVHSALRRDLARARAAMAGEPYPFDAQRIAIADHLVWMMNFLHHHHESEDEHLYPMVRERNADAAALLDEMDRDHRSILPAMEALETAAAAYRESADARGEALAAVDTLSAVLFPHLEREKNQMMPVVSRTITETQWRQWDQEYNVKPLGPMELSDQGLFILDSLDGEDKEAIAELVPAIPRWFILNVMIRRYRAAAFRRWRSPEFSPLKASLRGRAETVCTATPEAIWAVLADVTRVGEWSHECRSARWLDAGSAPGIGVRFRGSSKSGFMRWSRTCTFTTFDEPRRMAWLTDGGSYGDHTEWQYDLEPVDGGTRIVQTFRVVGMPVWFDRLIALLVPAHHDRSTALHDDLVRLAHTAERGTVPTLHSPTPSAKKAVGTREP